MGAGIGIGTSIGRKPRNDATYNNHVKNIYPSVEIRGGISLVRSDSHLVVLRHRIRGTLHSAAALRTSVIRTFASIQAGMRFYVTIHSIVCTHAQHAWGTQILVGGSFQGKLLATHRKIMCIINALVDIEARGVYQRRPVQQNNQCTRIYPQPLYTLHIIALWCGVKGRIYATRQEYDRNRIGIGCEWEKNRIGVG